jgi:hypothetical protein
METDVKYNLFFGDIPSVVMRGHDPLIHADERLLRPGQLNSLSP